MAGYDNRPTSTTPGRNVDNPHMRFLPDSGYFKPPTPGEEPQPRFLTNVPVPSLATMPPRSRQDNSIAELRQRIGGSYREPQHVAEYKPLSQPRYVPYIIRNTLAQADVTWQPPRAREERAIEISHAETVEVPVPPPVVDEGAEVKRRIVAYDDGDPFAFPVRTMPKPEHDVSGPELTDFAPSDLTLVQTEQRVLFFTPDRTKVFQIHLNNVGEGWSRLPTFGTPPPRDCVFVPFGKTHVVAFHRGDRATLLNLHGMTWFVVAMPRVHLPATPDFAHQVSEDSMYVRSGPVHCVLTLTRFEVPMHDEPRPGDEMIDIRRFRLRPSVRVLPSTPVEDVLVAVPLTPAHAVATATDRKGDRHTWIFRYEPKAMNWLPHERIEFAYPRGVRMGQKVHFFACDEKRERTTLAQLRGRTGGTCIVAILNLDNGNVKLPPTSGDVRIMLPPEDIVCLAPIPRVANTLLCLTVDMVSYLVLEIDRWEKLKSYAQGVDDDDADGSKFQPYLE